MKAFRSIYQLSFYVLSAAIFVLGGLSQFFFGVSNTVMTFLLMGWLLIVYLLYAFLKGSIVFNRMILLAILYLLTIVVSATVNQSHIVATLVYFIFPLLPVGAYLFAYINAKEKLLRFEQVFKCFFYIGLVQLRILLLQRNFYDFLIRFNRSGQKIESYDFMFGSFFIKSDHSLGVFFLLLIATILYHRKRVKHLVVMPWLAIFYLLLSLFLTESNISKLVAVVLIMTTLLVPVYRRYGQRLAFKIVALVFGVTVLAIGYSVKDRSFIQRRLGGSLQEQFSMERAEFYYERATAKRFQIVMVAVGRLKTKWIGDGPYSYFDIRSGKFSKAPHFSQLLWTYFDLGILGLLIVLMLLWAIASFIFSKKGIITLSFFGLLLLYAFYTTLFSDIAILFSLFTLLTPNPDFPWNGFRQVNNTGVNHN